MPIQRAMKVTAALAFAAVLATASAISWYVSAPPLAEDLPLTGDLFSEASAQGQRLLAETAHKADHTQLEPFVLPQRRRAFCGPATSAAVINAALQSPVPVTQFSVFATAAPDVKSELSVSLSGLTLDELAALLRAHGLQVRKVHAEDADAAGFRADAQAVLAEPLTFMVVNYDRRVLGQAGAGHISPIGAYHLAADRLLVMDVATYRYPFTWVPLVRLWAAMNTVDLDSGQTRGYLMVKASPPGDGGSGS